MRLNQGTDKPSDIITVEQDLIWSTEALADKYDTVKFEETRGNFELAISANTFPVVISGSQNPSNYLWIARIVIPIDNDYRQRHFTYQSALILGDESDTVPLAFKG